MLWIELCEISWSAVAVERGASFRQLPPRGRLWISCVVYTAPTHTFSVRWVILANEQGR